MANTFMSERKKLFQTEGYTICGCDVLRTAQVFLNKDICFLTTFKLDFRVFVSPPANFFY